MLLKLLGTFKTVAFLSDAGYKDEAYQLLETIDQIAKYLDLYLDVSYQLGRVVLITYIS